MRTQRSGTFRLTNGIPKLRHVFVFFVNNANLENQLANSFLYNTLVYLPIQELFHNVILKLETGMNIRTGNTNHNEIFQESFVM